mmetsp:Transcript_33509/g.89623  ORF Transcript_33509/g.89623 Transcript_33509/m.89623 type:complete len:306 (-) Transcript_33509:502-1419(-)
METSTPPALPTPLASHSALRSVLSSICAFHFAAVSKQSRAPVARGPRPIGRGTLAVRATRRRSECLEQPRTPTAGSHEHSRTGRCHGVVWLPRSLRRTRHRRSFAVRLSTLFRHLPRVLAFFAAPLFACACPAIEPHHRPALRGAPPTRPSPQSAFSAPPATTRPSQQAHECGGHTTVQWRRALHRPTLPYQVRVQPRRPDGQKSVAFLTSLLRGLLWDPYQTFLLALVTTNRLPQTLASPRHDPRMKWGALRLIWPPTSPLRADWGRHVFSWVTHAQPGAPWPLSICVAKPLRGETLTAQLCLS